MSLYDDSDMKIIGKNIKPENENSDANAILAEAAVQHFNGNMAKAKALGGDIVSAFSYKFTPDEIMSLIRNYGVEESGVLFSEIRILNVFCAEYCMDEFLPSPLLSTAAASEMFDVLQNILPEFYEQLSHSASFSFYYICVKNGSNIKTQIGKAFAEMCDDPMNSGLVALGSELFSKNMSLFKKAISGYAFV